MADDADPRIDAGASESVSSSREIVSPPSGYQDDHLLLERLRQDDTFALRILIETYAQRLEAAAYLVVRRDDLAQDAVQDVFIRLWEQRKEIRIQGKIAHYLFRAVRFRAISLVRHESAAHRAEEILRSMQMSAPPVSINAGDLALHDREFAEIVERTLESLPARCREIFMMHRVASMSYAEIAAALDIVPATVHNQMSRATRALMDALRRAGMLS